MKKRTTAAAMAMPMLMTRVALASWETIFHRGMMIAQGTCSAAEYRRMVSEKVAAAQAATLAAMQRRGPAAMLMPYVSRSHANARRLRRRKG